MVFRSDFPEITPVDLPIHEAVLGGAEAYRDTPALVDGITGRSLSYGELAGAVRLVAAGLAGSGLVKGDVLALYSPNTIAYPVAFYAASRAGATVTTVSSLATAGELAGQLRDSGARWLVTIAAFLPVAEAAAAELAAEGRPLREIVLCDETSANGHRTLTDLAAAGGPEPELDFDPGEDIAVLPYSSGTTGLPKGVMLSHRNIASNLLQSDSVRRPEQGEKILAVLPFFHIYGLAALLSQPLRCGATVVVLPRFELEQFLRTIQEQRIEGVFVAPPVVLALAKHPLVADFDLSSIKYLLCAAAPLDAELGEACAARLGLPRVLQGYGMTELSPVTHAVPLDDADPPRGTVGRMVASTELRIGALDGSGADLGPGERGELLFRGPQVMRGYFGRDSETAAMIDEEGWLHTGDVGYVDERGYLFVVDRVKELIKYKGYQVAPAELEALLLGHPEVQDAAVVGVTGADGVERPKAFVVRGAGSALTGEQLMAYVAERVAPYKKVRAVEFIEAVPKSLSGKILRRELRDRAAAEAQAPEPQGADRQAPEPQGADRQAPDRNAAGRQVTDPRAADLHAAALQPAEREGR
ncbi:AMP-dependent synthetase [Kitasatospora sp. MMS16-BH015]|uniref:4-coumarate--CoA ligase family protein n=1 Tax=Kitasatospora sp. MMS16-BH015 TaxID=2018025 RepID=UPI000CA139A4|nr:4-coumarate--CoA ligase family protein [Kitasatospora sp. MMS16-BH015]AUG75236.1 AMP-dependent synthetase [Kitasatospora sp. MMS16-BH015]